MENTQTETVEQQYELYDEANTSRQYRRYVERLKMKGKPDWGHMIRQKFPIHIDPNIPLYKQNFTKGRSFGVDPQYLK